MTLAEWPKYDLWTYFLTIAGYWYRLIFPKSSPVAIKYLSS